MDLGKTRPAAPRGITNRRADEQRVRRELAALMADPRYRHNSDFKAYVRRQFRRVYNDPEERRDVLRLGPPRVFATTLEPFRSAATPGNETLPHGRRRAEAVGSSPHPGAPGVLKLPEARPNDTTPASRDEADGSALILRRLNDVEALVPVGEQAAARSALERTRGLLEFSDRLGMTTASAFLRHFLAGSGTPMTVEPGFLANYGPARDSVDRVVGHFDAWLLGNIEDSRIGAPTLSMRDGERVVIGGDEAGPSSDLDARVWWTAAFQGAGEEVVSGKPWNLDSLVREPQFTLGGGTTTGYGYFVLERRGRQISVEGVIDFRITDTYDFDSDSMNSGLYTLQRLGLGVPFEISTPLWRRTYRARIDLAGDRPIRIDHALSGHF